MDNIKDEAIGGYMNAYNAANEINKQQELKNLGFANGWIGTPGEVTKCKHKKESEKIGNCLTKYTCLDCGFYYKVDSSG